MGCRDSSLRSSLLADLAAAFPAPDQDEDSGGGGGGGSSGGGGGSGGGNVWTKKLDECVNEIVVCVKTDEKSGNIDSAILEKHVEILKSSVPSIFDDEDLLCGAFSRLNC